MAPFTKGYVLAYLCVCINVPVRHQLPELYKCSNFTLEATFLNSVKNQRQRPNALLLRGEELVWAGQCSVAGGREKCSW